MRTGFRAILYRAWNNQQRLLYGAHCPYVSLRPCGWLYVRMQNPHAQVVITVHAYQGSSVHFGHFIHISKLDEQSTYASFILTGTMTVSISRMQVGASWQGGPLAAIRSARMAPPPGIDESVVDAACCCQWKVWQLLVAVAACCRTLSLCAAAANTSNAPYTKHFIYRIPSLFVGCTRMVWWRCARIVWWDSRLLFVF